MTTTTNTTTKKMEAPTMFYSVHKTATGNFWVLRDIYGKDHLLKKMNFQKKPSNSILKLAYERNKCISLWGCQWQSRSLHYMEDFKKGKLVFNFK